MFFKKKKPVQQEPKPAISEDDARDFIAQIPQQGEKIREPAKTIFGLDLDYSVDSIPKLDTMITDGWPEEPPENLDQMVLAIGCYLGETIRHTHGGDWGVSQELGNIYLDVGGLDIKVFPFTKVEKRFLNGDVDSLNFFYEVIRAEVEKKQAI